MAAICEPPPPAQGPPIAARESGSLYRRSLAGCAGCAYATLSYSTPAYRSLDQDRSISLLYSSALSTPRGLVVLDVNPNSGTLPEKMSLSLFRSDATPVPLVTGDEVFYRATSGTNRITAMFDASGFASGSYDMTAVVRNWWGTTFTETRLAVRVFIDNERSSPYGSGWTIAGLPHLYYSSNPLFVDGGNTVAFSCSPASSVGVARRRGAPRDISARCACDFGLAGEVNPYAYAGNDPVNYTDPSGTCRLMITVKYHYFNDSSVETEVLGTFWTGCDQDGEGRVGGGGGVPSTSGEDECGPILKQPGVRQAANRVYNRFLADPATREFGEELRINRNGHVFGVPGTPNSQQTDTSVVLELSSGPDFWGSIHSHPHDGRLGVIGDWLRTLQASRPYNKVIVTKDSLFLVPSYPGLSESSMVSEACRRK